MIYGVGVDIARIERFESFNKYSRERLLEIYSPEELDAANSAGILSEYYASRFAAKEAFYKAISNAFVLLKATDITFSFSFSRKHVQVVKTTWDLPSLVVDWTAFEKKTEVSLPKMRTHLSLSHESTHAIATVVLEGDV